MTSSDPLAAAKTAGLSGRERFVAMARVVKGMSGPDEIELDRPCRLVHVLAPVGAPGYVSSDRT